MTRKSAARTSLRTKQGYLDKLPPGAVILDGNGHAWQYMPYASCPYWYRAPGDDSFVSSYDLVQIINGKYTVIWPQEDT